jgi:NAD-dependent dihydropyrimidine dehydrogenase PreA subunit
MQRTIIKIDEDKCTGCGLCIPNCPEGAIQVIDGKARLVSDLMCDGLGACLGHCPEGAISQEVREAEPYDENKVMENIVRQGKNTIRAHVAHLREHGQVEYLEQALDYLKKQGIVLHEPVKEGHMHADHATGCPGAKSMAFERENSAAQSLVASRPSALAHWPVQMHLISPAAPHYKNSDLLLAADCVAYSLGDFHKDYLKGRTLAIACPKLDEGQEVYVEKIKALIDTANINTLTVMIMQVPCCGGLLNLAKEAAAQCKRKVPIKAIVVGLQGQILREEWQ